MVTNFLMITVDDMNYNAPDFVRQDGLEITPNINKLRKEGCFFSHAHVNVAVCQPSRQCIMTGKMPHNNGSHGFEPIADSTVTLQQLLKEKGYINGIIGKISHLAPFRKYFWDEYMDVFTEDCYWGRRPQDYYEFCREFFKNRKDDNKPFFLMANSHDPHRPFANSDQEIEMFGFHVPITREINQEDITVPGFLPDIPEVRKEVAQYYTSVYRADQTVGSILRALDESGFSDNTIVIFLSDNGMAFPFAKTNCYLNSTRTPLLIRWPNIVRADSTDDTNMISGVDFMPTILDIAGIPYNKDDFDGKSFLPVLMGEKTADFESVYTLFNKTSAGDIYEMRCIQDRNFGYIFNFWSDGKKEFKNESMSGLTFNAMKAASKNNEYIANRVNMFLYRTTEELYDYTKDPDALNNLAPDPLYKDVINDMRLKLKNRMQKSNDPLYDKL